MVDPNDIPRLADVPPASPREQLRWNQAIAEQSRLARAADRVKGVLRRVVELRPSDRSGGVITPATHGPHAVRFVEDWQTYSAGDVAGFREDIADQLVEHGAAVRVGPEGRAKRSLRTMRGALLGR